MRVTLLKKITSLVFLAVILVGGGNYAANRYFLSNTLDEQNVKEVGARADLVSDQFEAQKKSLIANGFLMATNPQVAERLALLAEKLGSDGAALGRLSEITHQQALIMAYNDAFHFVGIGLAISMVAVLMTRKLPQGLKAGEAH